MSKTKRAYHDGMCMRGMKNRPHKVEKSIAKDLVKNEGVPLDNRSVGKSVPEPYDDYLIAALGETKHLWKMGKGVDVKRDDDDTFNVFYNKLFVVNLTRNELKFFPWTVYLPIEQPPSMSDFDWVLAR